MVGVTVLEPDAATVPTPWSMERFVAPLEVQVSVEDPPSLMAAGVAVRLTVGGLSTDTVALAVTDPLVLVAVMVYVVVTVGVTLLEELAATVPMPWSMETVVAFVVVQIRVDEEPKLMDAGSAVIVTVGS